MEKRGKWFLEYTYDKPKQYSSDPHFHDNTTMTVSIEICDGIKSEEYALGVAEKKWEEVVSQKTTGTGTPIYNQRDPCVIYRIKTDFPVPEAVKPVPLADRALW